MEFPIAESEVEIALSVAYRCCGPRRRSRGRLVRVQNANTAAPAGQPRFTGWCLDKEDCCTAKLCAFREKDRNFVAALVGAGLVDAAVIANRLPTVPERYSVERALGWLASRL